MRVSSLTLSVLAASTFVLTACPAPPDPPVDMETETGDPPSCLDTQQPGEDIVLNFDADILELQLADCVPETIIVTGGGITNLTGLSELRQVGRLEIRFCPNLTVLTGLQDLTRVDTFIITGSDVLPMLANFNELEQVGNLIITGNDALTDIGKFPSDTLTGLDISDNATLADYSGLETVTAVTGNVTLSGNVLITDFTGLENLQSIGGDLTIEDNTELTNFTGLGVTSVGGNLTIQTNENLSDCFVEDWVATVDVGGAIVTSNNMSDLCD